MSKHTSADNKLRVSTSLKSPKQLSKPQLKHQPNDPARPAVGTNSKNQFR